MTQAAADATGLRAGTPVFAGGGDTQCALLGSDVVAPGRAGAVLGTTTPVMSVLAEPTIDPSGRLWSGCHVLPGRFTLESNSGDTGITWEWLLDLLGATDLAQVDVHAARHAVARLHARGANARSLARALSAWRSFYRFLIRDHGIAHNPFQGVRAPRAPRHLPQALSPDEAANLLLDRAFLTSVR